MIPWACDYEAHVTPVFVLVSILDVKLEALSMHLELICYPVWSGSSPLSHHTHLRFHQLEKNKHSSQSEFCRLEKIPEEKKNQTKGMGSDSRL